MDELLRTRIDEAGERRLQALAMAESALRDVLDLLPDALEAGLSEEEVARLAQMDPATLDVVDARRRFEKRFSAMY